MEKPQIVSEREQKDRDWERRQRIYCNALPIHAGRADLARMPFPEEDHPAGVLHDLLEKGAFESLVPPVSYERPPFEFWYQELRNKKRLNGSHPLALGFPLLLFNAGESLRVVPLFLFDLELEPDGQQTGYWRLSYQSDQRVRLNPWLEAYPPAGWEASWLEQLSELAKERPLTTAALISRLEPLESEHHWDSLPDAPTLQPFPDIDELGNLAEQGTVRWSGVIACFPPPAPASEPEGKAVFPKAEPGVPEGHAAAAGVMDPFQMNAFQLARQQRLTVLDGPSGTGKSYVVQQLVLNALSNGEKCLIISSTLESLRAARRQLDQLQLGTLAFAATGTHRDSTLLLELLRTAGGTPPPQHSHNADRFQQGLHKWEREKSKLDDAYRALSSPVFGKYSWAETTGLYLESSRLEGKELLTTQLNIQDFRFRFDEYEHLMEAVQECRELYGKVNTLRHPLQNLHAQVFLDKNREEARAYVLEQMEVHTQKSFYLQKRYIEKVNEYADLLSNYYEQWYDELHDQLQSLQEKIADAVVEYGADFELNSMTSLRLYGSFLSHFRRRLEAKKFIFANYHTLVATFERTPLFDFDFAASEEGRALPHMRQSLEDFAGALSEWREKLPDLIQENLRRLSSQTVHPELSFKGHILELEEALDLQLGELNRSRLYDEPFENRMLTIPRRRKFLEEVIEQLENTQLFMRDFNALYDWRRFWLNLTEKGRKLIQALVKVRPGNWEAAFKSWYLHHCLQQAYRPALPTSPFSLRQFVFNADQVQSMLPAQIAHHWWGRRQELMRELRRSDRRSHQYLFTRKNEGDPTPELGDLFEEHGEKITELLPVWMVTPDVARGLVGEQSCFDLVLIEESQLVAAAALPEGLSQINRVVVAGNQEWEALGPAASAFSVAREKAGEVCRLPYVHRWSPGNAPALRDPAYLVHKAISGFFARFEQVDGRYDEQLGTNEAEAQEVIRLLNEVEKTPQRTYPSIAIATMTIAQRDLIASYLRDIKQRELPGADMVKQLERNGLGVFYIEELAGQQPDVLLFSCTYGPVDLEGGITDHLLELNRPEGLAKLSLLMTRPRKAVFVVNSLPQLVIQENAGNSGQVGTFLLCNYLKYIYALHIADAEQQQWVIQNLVDHLPAGSTERPDSPFVREIALSLQSYIAKERIHAQVMDAHLYLPLKVDPASVEAAPAVVVPDGFFSSTPETDYCWEFEQQELYRQHGYTLVPAWSVNWWKNAAAEARNLVLNIKEKSAEERS